MSNQVKSTAIRVKMTPEQRKAAEELAKSCNMKVPELIRRLLESAETKPIISYEAVLK